jgi:glycine C-acetyltransferase/8-amino-7-oxononanoate synthase
MDSFGLNVAASRFTTGNHTVFGALEDAISEYFGRPATLFSSGYVTNLAFTQTFAEAFTHAFIDERSHGALQDAAGLLSCPVRRFSHRAADDLKQLLRGLKRGARPLVLTDGLFSQEGSIPPLSSYLASLPARGMMLVDDAHAAGILGPRGRGTAESFGLNDPRIVQTISLSKAFGVYGGAVIAAPEVIKSLQQRCRVFAGNTPLPLPLANAALRAIQLLQSEKSLRARLLSNTRRVKQKLSAAGWPVPDNDAPLIGFAPANAKAAAALSRALLRRDIFPPLIRYAGAPPHGAFRFALSSEHTNQQLDALVEALLSSRR